MNPIAEIENVLDEVQQLHHEYETNSLNGERDENWAGFYAAYIIGELGMITEPSRLVTTLKQFDELGYADCTIEPWTSYTARQIYKAYC